MNSPVKRHRGPKPRPANDNSSLRYRLRAARIPLTDALIGALGWGAAMALSAQAWMWLSTAAIIDSYWQLTALVFAGAALAWPIALAAFRFIAFGRGRDAAFAAAVLCLSIITIGLTAAIFALIYRTYYAQWHGETFTKLWLIQFVFTTASAVYQFAVQGLRLYLPLGVPFLFLAAYLLARRHGRGRKPKNRK